MSLEDGNLPKQVQVPKTPFIEVLNGALERELFLAEQSLEELHRSAVDAMNNGDYRLAHDVTGQLHRKKVLGQLVGDLGVLIVGIGKECGVDAGCPEFARRIVVGMGNSVGASLGSDVLQSSAVKPSGQEKPQRKRRRLRKSAPVAVPSENKTPGRRGKSPNPAPDSVVTEPSAAPLSAEVTAQTDVGVIFHPVQAEAIKAAEETQLLPSKVVDELKAVGSDLGFHNTTKRIREKKEKDKQPWLLQLGRYCELLLIPILRENVDKRKEIERRLQISSLNRFAKDKGIIAHHQYYGDELFRCFCENLRQLKLDSVGNISDFKRSEEYAKLRQTVDRIYQGLEINVGSDQWNKACRLFIELAKQGVKIKLPQDEFLKLFFGEKRAPNVSRDQSVLASSQI